MATAAPTSTKRPASEAKKVGRNAVTGKFVLAPASKGGKITIAKARSAASSLHSAKK